MSGSVHAVHVSALHSFTKAACEEIELLAGRGVTGDAHAGAQVKHRSRVAKDPTQPNLRQVHLIASELFVAVAEAGHVVLPGDLGENVTTSGIDLLALGTGTVLRLGEDALIAITGLRNPCGQIENFQTGLLSHVCSVDPEFGVVRKSGVMAVVLRGGVVRPGDRIAMGSAPGAHIPLVAV